MKVKDFTTRPVWADDTWLRQHAGETLGVEKDGASQDENANEGEEEKEKSKPETKVRHIFWALHNLFSCGFTVFYAWVTIINLGSCS